MFTVDVYCERAADAIPLLQFLRQVSCIKFRCFWAEKAEIMARPVVMHPRVLWGRGWSLPCVLVISAVLGLRDLLPILDGEDGT